jgi:hypothetical protein
MASPYFAYFLLKLPPFAAILREFAELIASEFTVARHRISSPTGC